MQGADVLAPGVDEIEDHDLALEIVEADFASVRIPERESGSGRVGHLNVGFALQKLGFEGLDGVRGRGCRGCGGQWEAKDGDRPMRRAYHDYSHFAEASIR